MLKSLLVGAHLLLALSLPGFAQPAGYPDRPIKLVVPWPSGGPTDAIARLIAEKLSSRVRQPVLVDNRAGANGIIGTTAVARAPADGYTLMLALPETSVLNPLTYKTISYRQDDLQPVAFFGFRPFALVASSKYKGRSVQDIIQIAKQRPNSISAASWGIGSTAHLAIAMIEESASVELLHVPFPGTAAATTQLIGGQVDLMLLGLQPAKEQASAGKLSILGVSSSKRLETHADIPTLAEQGLNVDVALWYGIAAPSKVSEDIREYLNKEINLVLQDASVIKGLREHGLIVQPQSRQAFAQFLKDESAKWSTIIKAKNIRVDN